MSGARGLTAELAVDVFDEEPEGGFTLEWALANRGERDAHVYGGTWEVE